MRTRIARLLRRAANRIDPPKAINVSLDFEAMNRAFSDGMRNIEASRDYARARYGLPDA